MDKRIFGSDDDILLWAISRCSANFVIKDVSQHNEAEALERRSTRIMSKAYVQPSRACVVIPASAD